METQTADLKPVPLRPNQKEQYFEYTCSKCGKDACNSYSEPYRTDMLAYRMCWSCNYWRDFEVKRLPKLGEMTIIDGATYGPGNRTEGSMRGMAGRRFDIEYIEPSIHAGNRITTFDLWSGGVIPDDLREKFPDTAKFLGGAARAQVGETTCWDQSSGKNDPYPLPRSIGIK